MRIAGRGCGGGDGAVGERALGQNAPPREGVTRKMSAMGEVCPGERGRGHPGAEAENFYIIFTQTGFCSPRGLSIMPVSRETNFFIYSADNQWSSSKGVLSGCEKFENGPEGERWFSSEKVKSPQSISH